MTSYGNDEIGYGIAVDHLGFVYVTGVTFSTDFATIDSLFDANAGQADCFVLKFDSNNGSIQPISEDCPLTKVKILR